MLKALPLNFVDGENNPVTLDAAYPLRGKVNWPQVLSAIDKEHGNRTVLLPMSARSSGGGVFQIPSPAGSTVVGLLIEPSLHPRCSMRDDTDLADLALNEIVICPSRSEICAGAGITLHQLNQALMDTVGDGYRVLGADLTSYTYAQVGATFLTGGMGPQRRYFSDSVTAASLFDGERCRILEGDELSAHAGTYGWTGIISAVRCHYTRLPTTELAFALPVDSSDGWMARLLAQLAPWCFLDDSDGILVNRHGNSDLILGIEHITLHSMEPLLAGKNGDRPASRHIRRLAEKCHAANCDGLVFVNGVTDGQAEDFLMGLIDNGSDHAPTMAGIDLEYTEVFGDPEEMRALRESIPYAARTQAPSGLHIYKSHTDATIRLDPNHVETGMSALWQTNCAYVRTLSDYLEASSDVFGQVLVYGHMNPWGVDPHNRVTVAGDDPIQFNHAVRYIQECTHHFYRELATLCHAGKAQFVGGEKSAGSEQEILTAFDEPSSVPRVLAEKFRQQRGVIQAAQPIFSWRAMPPYLDPQS